MGIRKKKKKRRKRRRNKKKRKNRRKKRKRRSKKKSKKKITKVTSKRLLPKILPQRSYHKHKLNFHHWLRRHHHHGQGLHQGVQSDMFKMILYSMADRHPRLTKIPVMRLNSLRHLN